MGLPPIARRPRAALATSAALALLAALASAGYVAWERPTWRVARETREALAAGRYAEAQAAAERWIRSRPRAAEAHFLRARAALAMGRRRDFVDGLMQAQALGHPEGEVEVLQAIVDAQAGRLDRARPTLIRAFNEARTPDLLVDEALARILMELYDWPHAGAVLARWGRDAPADPRPMLWHAAVLRRREADPAAIAADFREALRRSPGLAEARLGLAEELARAGKYREAAVEFDAYLAQAPDDPLGQLGAGRVALELGDLDLAARRFERTLALDPENSDAHAEQAKFARLRGDEAEALGHFDKAIALRPYDPAPRYNRKIALTRLGRLDEARREQEALDRLKLDLAAMNDLRERLNAKPDDARLQSRLAAWMFAHGYDQEGLKWADKILSDHPGHRETCALLAGYHEGRGHPELALHYRSLMTGRPPR